MILTRRTALLALLGRNRLLIAATLATALLGGLIVTLLISPKYVATASIQIDQEADRVLEGAEVQPQAGYTRAIRQALPDDVRACFEADHFVWGHIPAVEPPVAFCT